MQRGSGQTSEQMKSAPRDAVFVWCSGDLRYPTDLARHLGRDDLKIVRPEYHSVFMAAGGTRSAVVIDHAFHRIAKFEYLMICDFAAARNVRQVA
jgi:hypothetical protein